MTHLGPLTQFVHNKRAEFSRILNHLSIMFIVLSNKSKCSMFFYWRFSFKQESSWQHDKLGNDDDAAGKDDAHVKDPHEATARPRASCS